MSARDIVKFLPNERVDIGDAEAIQRNVLTDHRAHWLGFVFGNTTTAADLRRICVPFTMSVNTTSSVTVTAGVGIASELLPDNSREWGVIFGNEVQASQVLDFTGQPSNTYTVYVRYTNSPGKVGARVFWNSTTNDEDVDTIETRYVVDWDVTFGTSSPGDEYIPIGTVAWDGSLLAGDLVPNTHMFFEGDSGASYAQEWGDGANDRNVDRLTYGINDLYTWIHAVRRQITDIIGAGKEWYEEPVNSLDATRRVAVAGMSFTSPSGTLTATPSLGSIRVAQDNNTSGWVTGIQLPNGATVTEVGLAIHHTAGSQVIDGFLYRTPITGTDETDATVMANPQTTTVANDLAQGPDTTISDAVIDNENYAYALRVAFNVSGAASNLTIHGMWVICTFP